MNWISQLRRRRQMGEDLREEIREHIHERTAALMAEGVPREEAKRQARIAFGNPDLVKEHGDEVWIWTTLSAWLRDVQFAIRQLRKSPGFAVTTTLTLALGIGANLAVFNILDTLMLASLPVRDPESLVTLATHNPLNTMFGVTDAPIKLNLPAIEQIERRSKSFEGVFGWTEYDMTVEENGTSERIPGAILSGNAFSVLGLHPAVGRLLTAEDDRPGGGPEGWVAVIGYGYWLRHYGGSRSVIGDHLRISGQPVTIVGIAPRGFDSIQIDSHPEVYLPLEFDTAAHGKNSVLHTAVSMWLTTMARLKPGVTRAEAAAEMETLWPGILDATVPAAARHALFFEKMRLAVLPGRTGWSYLRLTYAKPLEILQGMVGLIFFLCCANLAGLCLSRAATRRHEFAIRGALGAARTRVVRQVLVESIVLALPGAVISLLVAWQAVRVLTPMLGREGMRLAVHFNPWLYLGAPVAGLLAAFLFGVLPAGLASRFTPQLTASPLSKQSHPAQMGGRIARWLFLPFQIAVSLVLVVAAGLLSSTLSHLYRDNLGFQTEGVYLTQTDFTKLDLSQEKMIELNRSIVQRVAQAPGVSIASYAATTPLGGWISSADFQALANGHELGQPVGLDSNQVGPRYFDAFGTSLLQGRDFSGTAADTNTCILNEAAARQLFGSSAALGGTVREFERQRDGEDTQQDCQVIGIVANAKYDSLREVPPPTVYRPFGGGAETARVLNIVVRARSLADARLAFAHTMDELGRGSPRAEVIPFSQQVEASVQRERMLSLLSNFFAVLALLLSGVGILGVMGWMVAQRTAEIGIRMALGATRASILRAFLKQGAWISALGLGIGLLGSWFAAGTLRTLLYGVDRMDPVVLSCSVVVLAATVITAAYFPARRAASTDPMKALRPE